jgi:hypothetical protein
MATKTDGWPQNFKKSELDAILRDENPKSMANTPVKTFRLDPALVKDLEKEAKAQHRTLSNYVGFLLSTHPDRKKKK